MDWGDIQQFREIARRGQIGAAARALGVTDATLRHRLAALELRLGEPLFERGGGTLAPTATASTLLALAEAMTTVIDDVGPMDLASGRQVGGAVRVTATESIGVEILTPLLVALQRRHPRLTLTLSVSLRNEDLLRGEADIAVRLVAPGQKAVVARAVTAGRHGLFANPAYLARAGAPARIEDLNRFALVGSSEATATPRVFRAMGCDLAASDFAIRIESQSGQLNAVRAGAGIGVALTSIAAADPDLLRVLPQVDLPRPAWVCMHEDLRQAPHVRVVFDALVAGLERVGAGS